jgi:hypothetical protein
MISAPVSRRYFAEITDGLVPALQAQGLVRNAYLTKRLSRRALRILRGGASAATVSFSPVQSCKGCTIVARERRPLLRRRTVPLPDYPVAPADC